MLNVSLYGYGTDFVGGVAYPKVERQIVYKDPEKRNRATIYNAAIVEENPWVKHLRDSGVYKEMKKLLAEARATYHPVNPANRKKNLMRQLNRTQKIYEMVNQDYDNVRKRVLF
jgi:hypothetical protein